MATQKVNVQEMKQGGARITPNKDVTPRFFKCEKCGKRIIERKENGIWYFAFGRQRDEHGNFITESPVEIYVYGSLKIKCLRRECAHWNTLNFFPFHFFEVQTEKDLAIPIK